MIFCYNRMDFIIFYSFLFYYLTVYEYKYKSICVYIYVYMYYNMYNIVFVLVNVHGFVVMEESSGTSLNLALIQSSGS